MGLGSLPLRIQSPVWMNLPPKSPRSSSVSNTAIRTLARLFAGNTAMSQLRTNTNQPLRITSAVFVLLGAVTLVGACNAGSTGTHEMSSDNPESMATAEQALKWEGGCTCVASGTCGLKLSCNRAPQSGECGKIMLCLVGRSEACYIQPDGTACGLSLASTCDGGYCGKCPGCYDSRGLCEKDPTQPTSCGKAGAGGYCLNCNDSNPCTLDTCADGVCKNTPIADGEACAGSTGLCYGGSCCTGCMSGSTCVTGVDPAACGAGGAKCITCAAPSNRCMRANCTNGACGEEAWPVDTSCADTTQCNGNEKCDGTGNCLKGTELDCLSTDPCWIGSCDPATGCKKTPAANTTKCTDNNPCTVGDLCDGAGTCVAGRPKDCSDGKSCTADACDPATGECRYTNQPNTTPCDDGAACTTNDQCVDGSCVGGGINCDDGKYCTEDSVDCTQTPPVCVNNAAPRSGMVCIPSNKCFYVGTCSGVDCVASEGAPVNCDDNNPCTVDSCQPARGCVHVNAEATTSCSDGNPCTTSDHCDATTGRCGGTSIVCAPIDDCHLPGVCDSTTGKCGADPRRDDGAPCMNGTGKCLSGACQVMGSGGTAGAAGAAGYAGELIVANAGSAGLASTPAAGTTGAPIAESGGAGGATAALNGGTGGTTTAVDPNDVFQRNPGGCSCGLAARNRPSQLALFGLIGVASHWLRRRRRVERHPS